MSTNKQNIKNKDLGVWFPTVCTGTGTDVSTQRLAAGLEAHGIRAQITWLPLRAEYAPWTVPVPKPPSWASVAQINTWMNPRFLPSHLAVVASLRHSVHHPDFKHYKGLARRLYHRYWIAPNERQVLRRADAVAAVSQFAADTGQRYLVDRPMDIIYNGIDPNKFTPGSRKRLPGEPFRLLYVGGWKKLKGVDLFPSIMRELGDGFELRYTGGEAAAKDKPNMPSNMHDIGRLNGEDAVIAAMQNADAFLFPSRSEGFGLVAAEAMACGLPVIAARSSSLTEVVHDGVTGLLCETGNVSAFVTACKTLAGNPGTCANQGHVGRQRVIDHFSYNAMMAGYINLYRKVLEA